MVEIISFEDGFYYPPEFKGLEVLVRFPDGGFKRNGIPNGTVWVFNQDSEYREEILGNDVGCGMTAFILDEIDHEEAADKIFEYLKKRGIIGRGNHFIDICGRIESTSDRKEEKYNILFLHTHGKGDNKAGNLKEAEKLQRKASKEREDLGYELSDLIKAKCKLFGDWPHNTVQIENGKIVYRKGVVKVQPEKVYFLPAHLNAHILVYTIDSRPEHIPPYFSMPHATGRKGPRGEHKVSLKEAASLRDVVYIPEGISDSSLRTEHPSCFNSFDKIIEKLCQWDKNYLYPIGEVKILSYIGKI